MNLETFAMLMKLREVPLWAWIALALFAFVGLPLLFQWALRSVLKPRRLIPIAFMGAVIYAFVTIEPPELSLPTFGQEEEAAAVAPVAVAPVAEPAAPMSEEDLVLDRSLRCMEEAKTLGLSDRAITNQHAVDCYREAAGVTWDAAYKIVEGMHRIFIRMYAPRGCSLSEDEIPATADFIFTIYDQPDYYLQECARVAEELPSVRFEWVLTTTAQTPRERELVEYRAEVGAYETPIEDVEDGTPGFFGPVDFRSRCLSDVTERERVAAAEGGPLTADEVWYVDYFSGALPTDSPRFRGAEYRSWTELYAELPPGALLQLRNYDRAKRIGFDVCEMRAAELS